MAGDGTLATTAIITGGLTCGHSPLDPCKTGIITSPFSLYCTGTSIVTQPSAGGGGYPYDAWNNLNPGEVQNFYQPVPLEYYLVPKEQEEEYLRRYRPLTITFKMGNISVEKIYRVPEPRRKIVVKVFNMMDITRKRLGIVFKGIKKVAGGVNIVIRNFRIRNK